MRGALRLACRISVVLVLAWPRTGAAQSSLAGDTIQISRASGPIAIDGDLTDAGWQGATRVETWYEINPGDNTEPAVKNVGHLTYDDRFFYAAFDLEDPKPSGIRAPLGDHDAISGDSMDLAGLFIDALNTGRTATIFLVNARNVQYDAVIDDGSGENQSPDFFWDSATRITNRGWTLEIRIPFSSIRYNNADPQTWGVLLYRSYPRGFRYQFASARIPRGSNCSVCRENRLVGLERLPGGGHLVAAPYVSASETARPRDEVVGAPLAGGGIRAHAGLDLKFTPDANHAIDFTANPDFSQIESDTAQISANERFALFFPEKRPFFLEGVDLFQTPIQAVYTRTITAPIWGGRATGKARGVRYTALVAEDEGGGSAILPGPNGSSFASQDFASTVFVGRAKRDIGLSSVGVLLTDREAHDGNGHNRVVGPDFQWRPSSADVISGQWLYSESRTPNRPDVADEWTGQLLAGRALMTHWNHSTTHLDWFALYKDVSRDFRADTGFVPQVGARELFAFGGWTVRPKGVISRQRTFLNVGYQSETSGALIARSIEPGVGMDTRWNGFVQLRYIDDRTRAGDVIIGRRQLGYFVRFSPSRKFNELTVDGRAGQEIDFANARSGGGPTINASATVQPTNHLAVALVHNYRRLNVLNGQRLLTARVSRVRGTYTFTSRLFVRAIAQYVSTENDPRLFRDVVRATSGDFTASLLLAYKLNWQSVMFAGYGDERALSDRERLEHVARQFFVKISYAFQR